MKLYIASDHAGFKLKKYLLQKFSFEDLGPQGYNKNDDYPDFAEKLARKVAKEKNSKGVLICGTGQGISIAANKVKGVYSALCYDTKSAKHAKEHNNANVISIPASFVTKAQSEKIIKNWLNSNFQRGRHLRRFNKIKKIEKRK